MLSLARVNDEGFLERRSQGAAAFGSGKGSWRDWWLVKNNYVGDVGVVHLKGVCLPIEYVGRRVRFRVEVVSDVVKKKVEEPKCRFSKAELVILACRQEQVIEDQLFLIGKLRKKVKMLKVCLSVKEDGIK